MSLTSLLDHQKTALGSSRRRFQGSGKGIATPQHSERPLSLPGAISKPEQLDLPVDSSQPIEKARVRVMLTNRWATFQCSPELQAQIKPLFSYEVPGARFSEAYKCGSWDGRKNLMARGRVASGLFLEMLDTLREKYRLEVKDQRTAPTYKDLPALDKTRSYQAECVAAMRGSISGGIVLVATGAGKTYLTGDYFRQLDGRAVFCVDELTLWRQAKEELEKAVGEEVGWIGNGEFQPRRITVATIQTLHKHRADPRFRNWAGVLDVVVIDEVHVAINKRNVDVLAQLKPKASFGLTATLELQKPHVRLPVTALTGPVIFRYPIQDGTRDGFLSRGKVIRVEFRDPLRGQAPGYWSTSGTHGRHWIPGWHKSAQYRYHVVLNKVRNDLVEDLAREALRESRHTIILVERLDHLRILSRRFQDVPHRVMSGAQSMEERFDAKEAMNAKRLPLILANRVFGKGIDISRVGAIVDATALPGRNSAIQRYGRGVRKAEGKQELLYYDVADRGNQFEGSAHSRALALQETGAELTIRKS